MQKYHARMLTASAPKNKLVGKATKFIVIGIERTGNFLKWTINW